MGNYLKSNKLERKKSRIPEILFKTHEIPVILRTQETGLGTDLANALIRRRDLVTNVGTMNNLNRVIGLLYLHNPEASEHDEDSNLHVSRANQGRPVRALGDA